MNVDMERIAQKYSTFAAQEAADRSPLYVIFANAIADDEEILTFLAALPIPKQQPNLLLAAMQFLFGAARDWQHFRELFHSHRNKVEAVVLERSTQTNEPGRCATLLPLLSRLPQPIALIEVGAAAGLCLLPDRYAYDFNGHSVAPAIPSPDPPVFPCTLAPATRLPERTPQIAWRAGLDLNPIDPRDPDQTRWLEALVWPGEDRRIERLRAALKIAAADPPRIVKGDLRYDLPALAAEAPRGVPLVVFHTAVLAYVKAAEDRLAFAETLRELNAIWICNESPGLFPEMLESVPKPSPCKTPNKMLMALNNRPIAWADPHGKSLEWFAPGDLRTDWN
jgi:hypothetical protein